MNREQIWKGGWNAALATVLSRIPGGNSCDPQQIADDIRELGYAMDGSIPVACLKCRECGHSYIPPTEPNP
jgi:hypothetical protein